MEEKRFGYNDVIQFLENTERFFTRRIEKRQKKSLLNGSCFCYEIDLQRAGTP